MGGLFAAGQVDRPKPTDLIRCRRRSCNIWFVHGWWVAWKRQWVVVPPCLRENLLVNIGPRYMCGKDQEFTKPHGFLNSSRFEWPGHESFCCLRVSHTLDTTGIFVCIPKVNRNCMPAVLHDTLMLVSNHLHTMTSYLGVFPTVNTAGKCFDVLRWFMILYCQ